MSKTAIGTVAPPVRRLVAGRSELSVVGQSVVRLDGRAKVLGEPIYVGDMSLPGMLHGMVLRSPHAHAAVRRIDTAAAREMPGVRAVVTAADIPGINRYGLAIQDQQALASEKVRYCGEAVALVAADTEEIAAEALRRIVVEYDLLSLVLTIEAALAPDAPRVHAAGNLLQQTRVRKGDVVLGFAEAAVIVEETYYTQSIDHVVLEPETSVAAMDEQGVLNIWTSTQYAFRDRRQIGQVLGLGMNRIRVASMTVGGGFGRKDDITTEIHAGLLALVTRKPVRLASSREESMIAFTHRHPMIMHCKTGARRDGKLTAAEATIHADTGAYASLGGFIVKKAGIHIAGPYYVPNIKADTFTVYTNNPISGPMRGFGVIQAAVAHESQMDLLAAKLDIPPLQFRLINALEDGLTTSTGQAVNAGCGIKTTLERIGEYMAEHGLSPSMGRLA